MKQVYGKKEPFGDLDFGPADLFRATKKNLDENGIYVREEAVTTMALAIVLAKVAELLEYPPNS